MIRATLHVALLLVAFAAASARADDPVSSLRFQVADSSGRAVPCRIHVDNSAGKPQKPEGYPAWNDHFVCNGNTELFLKPGGYRYEIERGPEHERLTGSVELNTNDTKAVSHTLRRIADLKSLGWYGGDLHVHRAVEDVPLLMQAEDLDIAPVITWWNQRNLWADGPLPESTLTQFDGPRFYDVMAGEDERGGGALLFYGLKRPIEITKAEREFPSPLSFVAQAREANPDVWIDIEKPFWWDVPVWLASGTTRTIGIANNHMCRSRMYENEAWGRPRDLARLPNPRGNGYWTQEIYYHALNCGLRLPPSAGSASGVLPNPVGYNRVYVHVDGDLTWDKWWEGLAAGRSFVTNGPLLLCRANRQLPGHTFEIEPQASLDVAIGLNLVTLDHVPRIEIIQNGEIIQTIATSDAREQQLHATLTVHEPGWFLVRAITDRPDTFRFASTAPYYVTVKGAPPYIRHDSAEFFLSWAQEREQQLRQKLTDPEQARAVLAFHEDAIRFWRDVVERATAE